MDTDMKQMMTEMNASIQGLAAEMRASIQGLAAETRDSTQGLAQRFEGMENRLDRKFNRLAMDFVLSEKRYEAKLDAAVADMKGIYNNAAWAADSAKVSLDKAITHGPMLVDHEDRIRALEGKRKSPPSKA